MITNVIKDIGTDSKLYATKFLYYYVFKFITTTLLHYNVCLLRVLRDTNVSAMSAVMEFKYNLTFYNYCDNYFSYDLSK